MSRRSINGHSRRRRNKKAALKMAAESPMKYVDSTGAPLSNSSGPGSANREVNKDLWFNTFADTFGDAQGELLTSTREGTAHSGEGLGDRLLEEQGRSMLTTAGTAGLYNPGTKFIYNLAHIARQKKIRETFASNWEEEGSGAMDLT